MSPRVGAPAPAYYEPGTPLIPGRHQPALVIDHLQSLDIDPVAALAAAATASGTPADHLRDPDAMHSPQQYLQMLQSCALALRHPETSFTLGRQALPGHFGAASHALLQSPDLRRALTVLTAHPARLSPLLVPHWIEEADVAVLYWTDAVAAPGFRGFLVELQMSAVTAMCEWLAGERLPWRFCFNRTRPRHTEPHEAYLGSRLQFNCQIDAMVIDTAWLDRAWRNPRAARSPSLHDSLDRAARAEESRHSFMALLYGHLADHVGASPGLEQTAQQFGLSPATLKRRLAAHGTHFQAELDQVRLHVALRLMHDRDCDNGAIARHLGFDDLTNFRRSFKRWSGLTPSLLRAALMGG